MIGDDIGGFVSFRTALKQAFRFIEDRYDVGPPTVEEYPHRWDDLPERLVSNAFQATDRAIAVVSPTLPPRDLALHMIARVAKASPRVVMRGQFTERHWTRISDAIHALLNRSLYIDAEPDLDADVFHRRVMTLAELQALDIFVLDCSPWLEASPEFAESSFEPLAAAVTELKKRFPQLVLIAGSGGQRFLADAMLGRQPRRGARALSWRLRRSGATEPMFPTLTERSIGQHR